MNAEEPSDVYSERQWAENKRHFMLDERERIADERERIADERERIADLRERLADQRAQAGDTSHELADQRSTHETERTSAAAARALARQKALLAVDVARQALTDSGFAAPLTAQFAALAQYLYGANNVDECLSDIALYAKHLAEADAVSVSYPDKAKFRTSAATDALALEVDQLQYANGEGPCLQAIQDLATVMSENLSVDTRWPVFAPLASEAGILSVLSVCMNLDGDTTRHFGSLNHYASTPKAFDATAADLAVILAAHAAVAIASVELREDYKGLQTALATRDIIGQAKGILMERGKITGDQAFDVLRQGSQLLNRRLRDIAEQIATTGEIPNPPGRRRSVRDV